MKRQHTHKNTGDLDALPTPPRKSSILRGKVRKVLFVSVGSICVLGAVFVAYSFYYAERIVPNTYIAGLSVGGMTKDQAMSVLNQKEQAYLTTPLTLQYQAREWSITPQKMQVSFSNTDALLQAISRGKHGTIAQQSAELLQSIVNQHYYKPDLASISEVGKKVLNDTVLKTIENQPIETTVQFIPGAVRVVPGVMGKRLNYTILEAKMYSSFKQGGQVIPLSLLTFQPEVSVTQAESARMQADEILSSQWSFQVDGNTTPIDTEQIGGWLATSVQYDVNNQSIGLQLSLKDDAVKTSLRALAAKINRPPQDAQIKSDNGAITLITDGQSGVKLDLDKTLIQLKSSLLGTQGSQGKRTILAVTEVVQPDVRKDTITALGIKELIGTGTTDFSGSPTNRVFNITLGQKSLNGKVVQPGQVFSTLGALGPVEFSTGYLAELSILGGKIIPEPGGGLCQVSTTLFRAVLNAGLPIKERTAHTYEVGYYERGVGPGLDATIYDPSPDFKWLNDTDHAILVQSSVKGNSITFELYGTKDGRTSTISTPQILQDIPVGPAVYANTDTLYKGQTKQIENAHNGAKTTVLYSVSRNGQEINHQVFNSLYQPLPAMFLVGTKDVPPSSSPSPTP